jgi:hypothetical protein
MSTVRSSTPKIALSSIGKKKNFAVIPSAAALENNDAAVTTDGNTCGD